MASAQDLKRQIQSLDNTSKMTQALQTISGIKLRKAENQLNKARPYADNVDEMMRDIANRAQSGSPLLVGREINRVAICTVTSDRGLAGGFNAQLLKRTMQLRGEQDAETVHVVTGRKAEAFFRFRGIGYEEAFTGFSDSPSYEDAQRVGRYLTRLFEDEEADEVYLIYNRYQSALVQRPVVTRLLPVAPEDNGEDDGGNEEGGQNIPLEFIPGPEVLLQRLVPRYVETLLFRAFLESAAGEHGARMTAMKSASDSANEMSEDLTRQMNRMRQAQITQEILEIVGGAEALAG